jgi:glutamate dehydrogenase
VLLAYAKLDLDAEVLASTLPEDSVFESLLSGYFPPAAVAAFPGEPGRHRLRREIVSTVLINTIVNLAGIVFVLRTREVTGLSSAQVARGFVLSDGAFGLTALKARIDTLDLKVDAAVQTGLYSDIADQFRRATRWFLAHVPGDAPITDTVAQYRAGVEALRENYKMTQADQDGIAELTGAGVPEDLARDMVLLKPLAAALDVALLAHETGKPADKVAPVFFQLGETLGLDRLRNLAERFAPPEHWDRLALRRLLDDLSQSQRGITRKLLAGGGNVEAWAKAQGDALERTRSFLNTLDASGELSVAKLMLASSQIQNLG